MIKSFCLAKVTIICYLIFAFVSGLELWKRFSMSTHEIWLSYHALLFPREISRSYIIADFAKWRRWCKREWYHSRTSEYIATGRRLVAGIKANWKFFGQHGVLIKKLSMWLSWLSQSNREKCGQGLGDQLIEIQPDKPIYLCQTERDLN